MDLGVSVLAGLGGGHLHDLAGTAWGTVRCRHRRLRETRTLHDDVPVLAKGRALHGEGERGPGIGLEASRDRVKAVSIGL